MFRLQNKIERDMGGSDVCVCRSTICFGWIADSAKKVSKVKAKRKACKNGSFMQRVRRGVRKYRSINRWQANAGTSQKVKANGTFNAGSSVVHVRDRKRALDKGGRCRVNSRNIEHTNGSNVDRRIGGVDVGQSGC